MHTFTRQRTTRFLPGAMAAAAAALLLTACSWGGAAPAPPAGAPLTKYEKLVKTPDRGRHPAAGGFHPLIVNGHGGGRGGGLRRAGRRAGGQEERHRSGGHRT
ncbi:hypothetical protein, partial [Nocardia abscessus]|uniref:hypothetical protein n=1 Tax=Nocardia abscessus TaxID=120957 RepID=UPI002453948A